MYAIIPWSGSTKQSNTQTLEKTSEGGEKTVFPKYKDGSFPGSFPSVWCLFSGETYLLSKSHYIK